MLGLLIQFTKKPDGSVILRCVRADGSVTWQRQEGARAIFFPLHDLTHYAVETTLGHRRGFFGLAADGWDLTDFGAPWPKGKLPAEALLGELIVGFLDSERAGAAEWPAARFTQHAADYYSEHGLTGPPILTDVALSRTRHTARQLAARWLGLLAGQTLELHFHST